jgi:hypothetical protein
MYTHYHQRYYLINFLENYYQNKCRSISKLNGCPATPIRLPPELIKRYQKSVNRCFTDTNFQPKTAQKFTPKPLCNGCRMDVQKQGVRGSDQAQTQTY